MFVRTTWQRHFAHDLEVAWRGCTGDDAHERARTLMGDNGWNGLLVPADDGGLGLGGTEAGLLAQSLGRALLPFQTMGSVPASLAPAHTWTPPPAGAAAPPRPSVAVCAPSHPHVIRSDGSLGYLLHDVPDLVLLADEATGGLRTVSSGRLRADPYAGPAGPLWAVGPRDEAAGQLRGDVGSLWAMTTWLRGAYLLGIGATALDAALTRARERRQFGRTIGRNQALAFPLAAQRARLEGLRLAVQEGLLGLAEGIDASIAHKRAEAFVDAILGLVRECVDHGLHVHGAAGLAEGRLATRCYRHLLAETPGAGRLAGAAGTTAHVPAEPLRCPRVIGPPEPVDVSASARLRVPSAVNDTAVPHPPDLCVHHLFERAAARYPDRTALSSATGTLTYAELDRRANRLAHLLREHGVGPDDAVGICLERGIDTIVAVLAVLKAGGAYVPLDPEYPAARLSFLLRDSAVVLLLTHAWIGDWLPETSVPVLFLDEVRDRPDRALDTPPDDAATAAHLAYVIYTSGSTGTPKGVEVEHRNLVNRLLWDARTFPLTGEDAILHHTSLSFDISVWEIFAPLVSGARLVVAAPKASRDPHALLTEAVAEGVTILACVPSLLDVLIEEDEPALADIAGLRRVFSGGEALPPVLCRRFYAANPGVELHNFYGPSECTIDVTHRHCRPEDGEGSVVPIGTPIDNVRVWVLDADGAPVPVGYPGELHVAGACVARGYRARPSTTAERFVPDPFSTDSRATLYRTGDVVRLRRDGAVEFLGRSDHQVKIRGHRIEPGEIRAELEAHPDVRTALPNVIPGPNGISGRIEAHVVMADGAAFDEARLLEHLREHLPTQLIPSRIGVISKVPLDTNGKIDHRALPNLAGRDIDSGADPGETPHALATLAARILSVDRVGPTDDFFAAGGTSLDAARFVSRARRELGLDIDVETFLAQPTIAALIARSASAGTETGARTDVDTGADAEPGTESRPTPEGRVTDV
ncbi:amino acid adenylation domain-containing protein [Embleya sp. MST-111070]|uniref:amino acid adenylation domain-containing protein n=1 Tax=Embleya sp. MST-111070 TaxID=3398231 RepID=UPI003F7351E3